VTDGVLRLLIGVISAGVLMCLVKFHIVSRLTSDASNIASSIGPTTLEPQMALVLGFIGVSWNASSGEDESLRERERE